MGNYYKMPDRPVIRTKRRKRLLNQHKFPYFIWCTSWNKMTLGASSRKLAKYKSATLEFIAYSSTSAAFLLWLGWPAFLFSVSISCWIMNALSDEES